MFIQHSLIFHIFLLGGWGSGWSLLEHLLCFLQRYFPSLLRITAIPTSPVWLGCLYHMLFRYLLLTFTTASIILELLQ